MHCQLICRCPLSQTTTPLSPCKELTVLPHTSWINMINDILLSSGRLVDSPGLHHYRSQAQRGRHGRSWGVDLSEIQFSAVQTNGFGLDHQPQGTLQKIKSSSHSKMVPGRHPIPLGFGILQRGRASHVTYRSPFKTWGTFDAEKLCF